MKSKKINVRFGAAVALPVIVLLAGCKDQNNTSPSTTTSVVSSGDTNTVMASADKTINADNSGKNERDRHDMTLTPGDQGGSDADRQITQRIRQTLVSGTNDFSMTAKNVKIITTNGMVTLRGPVNSDAEKAGIGMVAQNVAGSSAVDNQLEVKSSQ